MIEPMGAKFTASKKEQSLLESAVFKQGAPAFNQTARIILPGSKRQSLIHTQSEAILKHPLSKDEPLTSRPQPTPNQISHSQSNT